MRTLPGKVARRLWDSPTFTTWGSIGTRFLTFVLVLPLLLRELPPAEIAVWWLFSTITSLQTLADLGFAPTFTRLIAFAMGGAQHAGAKPGEPRAEPGTSGPNWPLIQALWGTMRVIYLRLTALAAVPLAVLGTWALLRPMSALDDPTQGWISWALVWTASATVFWGSAYSAYLEGVNEVALVRRWQALMSIATTLTLFAVLLLGGRLLSLVIASQVWAILNVLRNRQLCRMVNDGRMRRFQRLGMDQEVFSQRVASRLAQQHRQPVSQGVFYASGLVYAQVADTAALTTYLLAFRWIQLISSLSQAPFYSKIPVLARLRSEGRFADQLAVAQRGMRIAYWTYALGFVAVGLAGSGVLTAIGSRVAFADNLLWVLLGFGFFVERYGAMHIQLYSTTNHMIMHLANGVTGTIYVVLSLALLGPIGVLAFPVAVLVSYLAFYSWYAAMHDYRLFRTGFWQFERTVALPPALVVGAFGVATRLF